MSSFKEVKTQLFDNGFKFKNIKMIGGCFDETWKNTIDVWNDELKTKIEKHMPTLINNGINNAPFGSVQDPAGSAIGSPWLCGAGASGAIYSTFMLENIPRIAECSAIFNSTTDPEGQRVVHTHSPVLRGNPENQQDCMQTIRLLANAYLNVIIAHIKHAKLVQKHKTRLNLVPVSASIFGGNFKRQEFNHIDPSITLVSIALAIGVCIHNKLPIPKLYLYFYQQDVFQRAQEYMAFISKK